MSENKPEDGQEILVIEEEPVPVQAPSRDLQPARPVPQALTLLGAALAFVGREIVPRLATLLLDAWDRRAARPGLSPSDRVSEQPTSPVVRDSASGGGQRHRQRRRGQYDD